MVAEWVDQKQETVELGLVGQADFWILPRVITRAKGKLEATEFLQGDQK